jgi:hypothetical protein
MKKLLTFERTGWLEMRGDIPVHSVMAESCLTKDYPMMCRYTYLIHNNINNIKYIFMTWTCVPCIYHQNNSTNTKNTMGTFQKIISFSNHNFLEHRKILDFHILDTTRPPNENKCVF